MSPKVVTVPGIRITMRSVTLTRERQMEENAPVMAATGNTVKLGGRIRGLREARGWTRPQLAEKAGVDLSYISRLERDQGGTSIPQLLRVAQALGAKLDDILAATPDQDLHAHVQARLPNGDPLVMVLDRIIDLRAERPDLRRTVEHLLRAILALEAQQDETGEAPDS